MKKVKLLMKRIIETSKQYYNQTKQEKNNKCCPECGSNNHSLGTYHLKNYGFLGLHSKKITTYRCMDCGCSYEIEEDYF